jgi:hypothetical protein
MSLLRPTHWYHSRGDLIWPVGPFHGRIRIHINNSGSKRPRKHTVDCKMKIYLT